MADNQSQTLSSVVLVEIQTSITNYNGITLDLLHLTEIKTWSETEYQTGKKGFHCK